MRCIYVILFLFPLIAFSQLQLAKIFTDNMVLQREQLIHIWGKGIPEKIVSVSLSKENKNSKVNPDSTWDVYFSSQTAKANPQTITVVSGNERIQLQNILIGDVWVCIGQSNMEWPMMREMHFKTEMTNSYQPVLRFYNPTYAGKNIFGTTFSDSVAQMLTVNDFYRGQWESCDSTTFKTMSAVAYYFGKQITGKIKVPIGLINISVGGAPLETFINSKAMKNSKQFSSKLNGDWLTNDALPVWIRERGKQNVGSITNISGDEYGRNHAYKPGFAYSAGIEPILNMPIKGILCYQGESNAQEMERLNEYGALSAVMINDYRKKWKQPQLPFYYIQISSIDTVKYKSNLWPQFRDEQRKMMSLIPNSGMAVCSDIGFKDDVHPTNKKEVGERLARWALNNTYHLNIIPSGPLPFKAKCADGVVVISFQYTAKGLKTADGKLLRGFSLDGKTETQAIIQNNTAAIDVKEKPEFVYYAWKPFADANLVNSELLPASTFKLKVQ